MLSVLMLFVLFGGKVLAQSTDREITAITHTLQLYFDGMMERDRNKLDLAFDPSARLIGYRGDNFTVTHYEEWASGTSAGTQKRDPKDFTNNLLGIEIKGYTALAKTELFWPGIYYYDYLTLIRIDGQWKIVHKTWYEEKR